MRQDTPPYFRRLLLGVLLLWPAVCVGVGEDDFWRDPATYGNGQSVRFYRAIKGGQPLSPEEEQTIKDLTPVKDTNRYYVRLGLGLAKKTASGITNQSNEPLLQGLAVRQASVASSQKNLFAAVGYVWEALRLDVEYVATKSLDYNPYPLFDKAATPQRLNAKLDSTTVLVNFFYDYRGFEHIYPYVMLSAGGTSVRAKTTITPLTPATAIANGGQKSFGLSYGAGLGIRFGVFSSLYLDLNARYIALGSFKLTPQTKMRLEGRQTLAILGIGAMWLF